MPKVPTKNVKATGTPAKNLPGAPFAHYPAEVVASPAAVKGAVSSRHGAHKAHGRHPRGV